MAPSANSLERIWRTFMRSMRIAVLFGFVSITSTSAFAESVANALETFGLVGTWSTDCALRLREEDVFVRQPLIMFVQKIPMRRTFKIPWFGVATVTTEIAFKQESGENKPKIDFTLIVQEEEINEADRATSSKIALTVTLKRLTFNGVQQEIRSDDKPVQHVIEKVGDKIGYQSGGWINYPGGSIKPGPWEKCLK